jgi:hypothetical protein
MNRRTSLLVLFAASFILTQVAVAERYTCTAAKEIAKVGVHRGNEVGVVEDNQHRECRFSVNGAPTGSPPIELVFEGLNAIITGQIIVMLQQGNVGALANLLLAPSRLDSPSDELITNLRFNSKALADCFDAHRGSRIGFTTQGTGMNCRIASPGNDFRQLGGITAEITFPQLQLFIDAKEINLYLFVPLNFRNGQPLSPP